jgi:hypothetical protein
LKIKVFAVDRISGSKQGRQQQAMRCLLEIKQTKIRSAQGADVKFSGETDE